MEAAKWNHEEVQNEFAHHGINLMLQGTWDETAECTFWNESGASGRKIESFSNMAHELSLAVTNGHQRYSVDFCNANGDVIAYAYIPNQK